MWTRTIIRLIAILLLASVSLMAQDDTSSKQGKIEGRVTDSANGTPLIGATIVMVGRFGGGMADTDGAFQLKKLAPGTYTLKVSHVGYEPELVENVEVVGGQVAEVSVELNEKVVTLKTITVTPGRFQIMGAEPTARQSLTQSQMATVPQLGDDFFRAVKRLPGMSGNDFSTRFTVRGGEYDEVLVTLDGLEIYEPFHLKDIDGGAISVIDVAAVDGIDLMTGGFPAKYGDKMSGVFDIRSKQISPDHKRMSVGLSMMNLRFLSEGNFADNRGSWLVSARRGYIDLVLKLAGADNDLKPTYYDLFGKTRYRLNDKNILAADFLHAGDDLRVYGTDEDTGDTIQTSYGNTYGWLTLWSEVHPKITARTIASIGRVKHDRLARDFNYWAQGIKRAAHDKRTFSHAGLKSDWEVDVSEKYFLRLGVDAKSVKTDYDYINQIYNYQYVTDSTGTYVALDHIDTTRAVLNPSGSKIGAYLSNRVRPWKRLTFELGLRYDRASYSGDNKYSPRVNVVYDVGSQTALRAGWGHFYQAQGVNEIMVGDGETGFYPAERAEHFVVGLQHTYESGVHLRLEGYYKKYTDLRPDYRNSFEDIEIFPETEYDRIVVDRERSTSKGFEVYLKKDTGGKISWWASYGYAKVEDSVSTIGFIPTDGVADYNRVLPSPNDQRHTLYLDWSYRPNHHWQFNLAFKYHTGWPYTGVFIASAPIPGGGTRIYLNSDEQLAARHESYKRIDLRINRYWSVGRGRITAFVELINVLDNKNIRSYIYDIRQIGNRFVLDEEPEHWFPRLPSFGVSYEIGV